MAVFNPEQKEVQPGSYLGLSQGPGVNKSFGSLFEGAGQVISGGLGLTDFAIQRGMKEEARALVEAERSTTGVPQAQELAASGVSLTTGQSDPSPLTGQAPGRPSRGLPPGAKNAITSAQRIQEGYQTGQYGELYHHARITNIAEHLRAKYPGYKDEVDAEISRLTGGISANSLRKELQKSLDASARAAAAGADKTDTFIKNNLKYLSVGSQQKYMKGESSGSEVIAEIGVNKRTEHENDVLTKQWTALKTTHGVFADEAERTAILVGDNLIDKEIRTFMDSLPPGLKIENGKPLGEKELLEFNTRYAEFRARAEAILHQQYSRTISPDGTPYKDAEGKIVSLSSYLHGKLPTIVSGRLARLDAIKAQADAGYFANAKFIADHNKMKTDTARRDLIAVAPELLVFEQLQTMLGQNWNYLVVQSVGKDGKNPLISQIIQTTQKAIGLANATGKNAPPEKVFTNPAITKPVSQGGLRPGEQAQLVNGVVESDLRTALAPGTDPQASRNLLWNYFREDNRNFLSAFRPNSAQNLYLRLVTPEIEKKVIERGISKEYYTWADNSFDYLLKEGGLLADVQDLATNPNYKLSWNGQKIVAEWRPGRGGAARAAAERGGDPRFLGGGVDPNTNPGLVKLNQIIAAYSGVAKGQGADPGEAMYRKLLNLGFNPDAKSATLGDALRAGGEAAMEKIRSLNPGIQVIGNSIKDFFQGDNKTFEDIGDVSPAPATGPRSQINLEAPMLATGAIGQIVQKAEGATYNTMFGGSRHDLVNKTVGEVMQFQRDFISRTGLESSAAGQYQTVQDTLKRAVRKLKIPLDQKFDEDTQDQIGNYLILEEGGGKEYLAGEISKQAFADKLAGVWAGLPLRSGKSAYHGVGSNKATVSRSEVLRAIDDWTQEQNVNPT